MKITVKDAFGTDVGEATVVWFTSGNKDAFMMDREVADIFMPITEAVLVTRNPGMAWRLVIMP